jgi:hypothetical protein
MGLGSLAEDPNLSTASDVPGPAAYDPKEPEAPYKHGAFLEKDKRFKEGLQGLGDS